jgi:hypothetical protein
MMKTIRREKMARSKVQKDLGQSWLRLKTQTITPNLHAHIGSEILENIAYSSGDRAL